MTDLAESEQLTDEEFLKKRAGLTERQKKVLDDYLAFLAYDDKETGEAAKIRKKIYKLYTGSISDLIARIEVYAHDLPNWLQGLIETLFRLVVSASSLDEQEACKVLTAALKFERFLLNTLQVALIDIYRETIKDHMRALDRFHQGVKVENTTFGPYMKACRKDISRFKRKNRKKLKRYYAVQKNAKTKNICRSRKNRDKLRRYYAVQMNEKTKKILDIALEEEACDWTELCDCLERAKKGVETCEENYSQIIGNGYVSTLPRRLLRVAPDIVSFALAVIGAILLIRKWGLM